MSWPDQKYVKFPFVKTINIQCQNGLGTNGISIGKDAGYSNQGTNAIAIGNNAGNTNQGQNAVAIGNSAGQNTQGLGAVAVGATAGQINQGQGAVAIGQNSAITNQGVNAVAIGISAGQGTQGLGAVAIGQSVGASYQGANAVAIGSLSGRDTQGSNAVAIGRSAGVVKQGNNAIAIGGFSGLTFQSANAVALGVSAGNTTQGVSAIAIGSQAGQANQGANAIAIGQNAGQTGQFANSICLNASGVALNPAVAGCFINPIRNVNQTTSLGYDTTTKEVTYNTTVETVAGTAAISPTIPITILSGTTHSLASGTTIGQKKTIVNANENAFSPIFTNATQATGSAFIRCLKYDPVLNRMYVGGDFTTIGGVVGTSRIAYYDFTAGTWNAMGGGAVSNSVNSIQISGTKVFASGNFNDMGALPTADNIAFWDTTTSLWTAMSPTAVVNPSNQTKLIISGNFLYMFGSFTLVNGVVNTVKIARWDITAGVWSAMGTGMPNNTITNAVVEGTNIWFCGSFTSAGGVANTTYLARWDTVGNTWNGYGASQVTNQIQTIQQVSPGFLVLIGSFTTVGTTPYLWTVLFNTSMNAFSFIAPATNQNVNGFVDTDNTVWLIGNYISLGNFIIGSEDYYYPTASRFCFYDTTIGKWCPLFTNGSNNILAMERTNVAGEYWLVGDFTNFDGYALTGLASLMRFTKPNLIRVDSNLIQNGVSTRNSFGMTYKGQSIDLLNVDNSKWAVVGNSPSTSTAPVVILY